MSKPRGPFHPISRPGSSFTDQQRKELSAFVSNALNAQAEEILASVAETFRQWHANYVEYGCLVPDGVERINAARDARKAELAAAATNGQVPAQTLVASQPEVIAEPVDLASPIIQ